MICGNPLAQTTNYNCNVCINGSSAIKQCPRSWGAGVVLPHDKNEGGQCRGGTGVGVGAGAGFGGSTFRMLLLNLFWGTITQVFANKIALVSLSGNRIVRM